MVYNLHLSAEMKGDRGYGSKPSRVVRSKVLEITVSWDDFQSGPEGELTGAAAQVGVVCVGSARSLGHPGPVSLIPFSLDHPTDVLPLKITRVQEGGGAGWTNGAHRQKGTHTHKQLSTV